MENDFEENSEEMVSGNAMLRSVSLSGLEGFCVAVILKLCPVVWAAVNVFLFVVLCIGELCDEVVNDTGGAMVTMYTTLRHFG